MFLGYKCTKKAKKMDKKGLKEYEKWLKTEFLDDFLAEMRGEFAK